LSHITSFRSVSDEIKDIIFKLYDIGYSSNSAYHTYWEQMQLKYANDEEIINMFSQLEEKIKKFNINGKGDYYHELQEAEKLVYMDTTAKLDILNTLLTILSTSTPASGLPLAAILTYDETVATFTKALDVVKKIVPSVVFSRQRSIIGPQVVMTDDYRAEKLALHNTWPNATLLLCIQAYNVIQIFQFFINTMDLYYVHRLLVVAYNKLDNFITLHFELSEWLIRMKDNIEVVDLDSQASIAKHYKVCRLNQIPITSVEKRYDYTYLTLDEKDIKDTYVRPAVTSFLHTCNRDSGRINDLISSHKEVYQEEQKENSQVNNIKMQEVDYSLMSAQKKHQKKYLHNLNQAILKNIPNGTN
ncbi:11851_t:CDS:2, partial [Scutellospora calospora]